MNVHPNYMLLDAARLQANMGTAKELNLTHRPLYREQIEKNLVDVAPYLFKTEKDPAFVNWYKENGWGNAWGLLVQSQFDFEIVYRHFQKFLLVKTEDGQELYFRFYDPRVLRIFLPTCDTQQLKEFFGPIQKFICEDEDAGFALSFSFDGKLITEKVFANTIFKEPEEINKTAVDNIQQMEINIKKEIEGTQQPAKPKRRFFY